MTLHHSKTWPVSTLAVVQLRVDQNGRTYSTLTNQPPTPSSATIGTHPQQQPFIFNAGHQQPFTIYENQTAIKENVVFVDTSKKEVNYTPEDVISGKNDNNVILPLSKKHLELFNKMSTHPHKTIRTDTVSTILEQDTEFEYEKNDEAGRY